jgi:hypothetical protein
MMSFIRAYFSKISCNFTKILTFIMDHASLEQLKNEDLRSKVGPLAKGRAELHLQRIEVVALEACHPSLEACHPSLETFLLVASSACLALEEEGILPFRPCPSFGDAFLPSSLQA